MKVNLKYHNTYFLVKFKNQRIKIIINKKYLNFFFYINKLFINYNFKEKFFLHKLFH